MKIAGVVVLYNPNIEEVFKNTLSYIKFLKKLYIVDNSEYNNEKNIKNMYFNILNKVEYIWLGGNKGIAKALNIGKNKAIKEKFKYLLTMDQDSFFDGNLIKLVRYIKSYSKQLENVAIISPQYKLREKKYNLKTYNLTEEIELKKYVMTSGNFLNLELAKQIGDFNEEFFIDEVDNEYCYRINRRGYKILMYKNCNLNHELGNIKWYFFIKVTNHNYIRRYYITRNKLYMMKEFSEVRLKYFITFFYDLFKIIGFETDKRKKIISIIKGITDFLENKSGEYKK